MNIRECLIYQYRAGLAMLRQAIERCPEELWVAGEHPRHYWRIAYHALFYTHFYAGPGEEGFVPWEHHRQEAQFIDIVPWPPHCLPKELEPYSRQELLAYEAFIDETVESILGGIDLEAPECGFWWYKLCKLDHELMNVRHLQGHVGQLSERLMEVGVDLDWIGSM